MQESNFLQAGYWLHANLKNMKFINFFWCNSVMKILHLATSLSGGAGIAARRICEAQRSQGMDSRIIGGQTASAYSLKPYEKVHEGNLKDNLESSITTVMQRYALQNSSKLITSFSTNKFKIKNTINDYELVHIHANYNFLNLSRILELSKRTATVVTLHDQRYFTGGCHYSFECNGYTGACENCPQVRSIFKFVPKMTLKKSIEAFGEMKNLEAIAPSEWIADLASKSRVLGNTKIWTVANPVPEVFKPLDNKNDESGFFKVGFVSQNLNNPYKGLDVLLQAISKIENKIQIELRLFGRGIIPIEHLKSRVVFAQFEGEEEASKAYNSCDLIIVPSSQDNFPSVVTEALSCGVPVIGSDIGGISEVLNTFGLPTFQSGDAASLATLILNFNKFENHGDYAKQAEAQFSFKESARKHELIYSRLL